MAANLRETNNWLTPIDMTPDRKRSLTWLWQAVRLRGGEMHGVEEISAEAGLDGGVLLDELLGLGEVAHGQNGDTEGTFRVEDGAIGKDLAGVEEAADVNGVLHHQVALGGGHVQGEGGAGRNKAEEKEIRCQSGGLPCAVKSKWADLGVARGWTYEAGFTSSGLAPSSDGMGRSGEKRTLRRRRRRRTQLCAMEQLECRP